MDLVATALLSGLFAGVVAVTVTMAIERFGGQIGGILATLPTTIIPASIGLSSRLNHDQLQASMFTVPVGMLVSCCFLYQWRFWPPRLPAWSINRRLAAMIGVSLSLWFALASIAVSIELNLLDGTGAGGIVPFGSFCFVLQGTIGILACLQKEKVKEAPPRQLSPSSVAVANSARGSVPIAVRVGDDAAALQESAATSDSASQQQPQKGAGAGANAAAKPKPVSFRMLIARGCMAGLAVFISVLLSSVGGVVSGIATCFPAIFITVLAGLWISQGEATPTGAVGPMMIGGLSPPCYAMLFRWVRAGAWCCLQPGPSHRQPPIAVAIATPRPCPSRIVAPSSHSSHSADNI